MEVLTFLIVFAVSAVAVGSFIGVLTTGSCLSCGLKTYLSENYCPACKKSILGKDSRAGSRLSSLNPFSRARRESGVLRNNLAGESNKEIYSLVLSLAVLVGGAYFFYGTKLLPKTGKSTFAQVSRNPAAATSVVIGNRSHRLYYPANCADYSKIPQINQIVFTSVENAELSGYKVAGGCP